MTLTRRDTLRLALVAGAGSALPSAITPAQAAALLAAPLFEVDVDLERDWFGRGDPLDPFEPGAFAGDVDGHLPQDELVRFVAPREEAAYKQARSAMVDALPELRDLPSDHPWHKMDEAAYGWAAVAYMRGVVIGARIEALRQALLAPVGTCDRCDGVGALYGGRRGAAPASARCREGATR